MCAGPWEASHTFPRKIKENDMTEIPTVEMVGPAGSVTVNYDQVARYEAQGYKRADEPEPPDLEELDTDFDAEDEG